MRYRSRNNMPFLILSQGAITIIALAEAKYEWI
jgi:hypothetical protein